MWQVHYSNFSKKKKIERNERYAAFFFFYFSSPQHTFSVLVSLCIFFFFPFTVPPFTLRLARYPQSEEVWVLSLRKRIKNTLSTMLRRGVSRGVVPASTATHFSHPTPSLSLPPSPLPHCRFTLHSNIPHNSFTLQSTPSPSPHFEILSFAYFLSRVTKHHSHFIPPFFPPFFNFLVFFEAFFLDVTASSFR